MNEAAAPGRRLPLDDGELYLVERLLAPAASASALAHLIDDTPWRQDEVTVWGRRWPQPRLAAWYGDPEARYRYARLDLQPLAWTPVLLGLKAEVEQVCGQRFNSVLLNYYRDQGDAMGMHADDEPELGARPLIASLSLGATRRFAIRHRRDRGRPGLDLDLADGSLLIMAGDMQQHWKHGLRRQRRPCGPRVNLTFRRILTDQAGAG